MIASTSSPAEWRRAEPAITADDLTGPDFLAKRAAWDTWWAQGIRQGYVGKWDPTQPRDVTGQWTAGGSSGKPAGSGGGGGGGSRRTPPPPPRVNRPATDQAEAAAQGRQTLARNAADQANALAAAQSRVGAAGKGGKANTSAAAKAARGAYGIPSGKKFSRLPKDQQDAAAHILAATRTLATLKVAQAAAANQVAAAQKELSAKGLTDKQRAALERTLGKAQARQKLLAAQHTAAQGELNAARKKWHGKHPR